MSCAAQIAVLCRSSEMMIYVFYTRICCVRCRITVGMLPYYNNVVLFCRHKGGCNQTWVYVSCVYIKLHLYNVFSFHPSFHLILPPPFFRPSQSSSFLRLVALSLSILPLPLSRSLHPTFLSPSAPLSTLPTYTYLAPSASFPPTHATPTPTCVRACVRAYVHACVIE